MSSQIVDPELDGSAMSQFDETDLGRALIARDCGLPLSDEQKELLAVFDACNVVKIS